MATRTKQTFTLDAATVQRIARTAARLGIPKSAVICEAVAEYAHRAGRLSDRERTRMLEVFDSVVPRIPHRTQKAVDSEIDAVRHARRSGGRRSKRPDRK
jgi:hypothetical protein